MANFLKRNYLNDAKLAQRALLEFHRALSSGRLIAFTGSLTTQPYGYGSWGNLVSAYSRLAGVAQAAVDSGEAWNSVLAELEIIAKPELAKRARNDKINDFSDFLTSRKNRGYDVRVGLSLLEEVLLAPDTKRMNMTRQCGDWELDTARRPLDLLSIAIAQYFRKPHQEKSANPDENVLEPLLRGLGVSRFATLNYDFELERRLMLADFPAADTANPFGALCQLRANSANEVFGWQLSSGRIRRVMPAGQAIESDILNRERIDRLLEFAIGADDVDHHIMHLHGRACNAESMILSYRDYDKLYRRSGLSKMPFEFAQRIMMGGNPILFVGMGMSEGELNRTLEDFVSSSPYQRTAPAFLLWNASEEDRLDLESKDEVREKEVRSRLEMRRLDWLHRLGILTIFDTDLPADRLAAPKAETAEKLTRLIEALPEHARRVGAREAYTGGAYWRHMSKAESGDGPAIVWEVALGKAEPQADAPALAALVDRLKSSSRLTGIIARQGSGKGSLAWKLAHESGALKIDPADTMLINGSFSFDTDSLLDAVTRFVSMRTIGTYSDSAQSHRPRTSRSEFFRKLKDYDEKTLLIVLNGSERFFSVRGEMLSAELHELLQLVASGKIPCLKLVLLGTARARAYLVKTLDADVIEADELGLEPSRTEEVIPVQRLEAIRHAFGKSLRTAGEHPVEQIAAGRYRILEQARQRVDAASAARISGDMPELRRAFFDLYLDPAVLAKVVGEESLALTMEILRALAFIGLPAEIAVLRWVPRIQARLAEVAAMPSRARSSGELPDPIEMLADLLKELKTLGLVLELRGYRPRGHLAESEARFTLPRMLLTELRARFSVPLSEAKLSTAFNMSLYVAQPVDGYIPEPDIHDELGMMVDHLLGAYRDMAREKAPPLRKGDSKALQSISTKLMPHENRAASREHPRGKTLTRDMVRELQTLVSPANAQCLRAALALIRGYYNTTDLLTLDVVDRLVLEDRDGILLEHAERLDAIIDAYGKVAMARDSLRDHFGAAFAEQFGDTEPLYADELVWLHNERGVIRLAMGDLYEARASFLRALEINRKHVERSDRSHNWRRIRLNQLTLDLESGEISLALRKIEEIIAVSETSRIGRDPKVGSDATKGVPVSREDELAIAVATGYRGWAADLQGEKVAAHVDYDAAIAKLSELGEVRAEVYFRRLRIMLLISEQRITESQRALSAAMDLALASRQMDLIYRLRIIEATIALSLPDGDVVSRRLARRQLEDAQRYALQTDVNRVRVEAGISIAESRLISGDHEGALSAVSDAIMIATRFGMELRKIILRSVMANIMANRGHPITAKNLASTAIRIGSRLRYYEAIRHAERTLEQIPPISAITELLDAAERRQT